MANTALAVVERVKAEIATRGIDPATWNVLTETLYPGANPASVLLVWDYCQARKLDPLKRPVHIVPMRVKVGDQWQWRDQMLSGSGEYRITAHRTGEYLGHEEPAYGPEITVFGVKAPEWCKYTVYRWNQLAKLKVAYTVTTKFAEVCGTKAAGPNDKTLVANGRWERAPFQMLTKCAEAAALREAFPEEIGSMPTVEEIVDHDVIDVTAAHEPAPTGGSVSTGMANFLKVEEELRDRIERGFAALKPPLSEAQRLMKINQTFGALALGASYDEVGTALLEELKDAYANQQGRPRETSNAKAKPTKESAMAHALETSPAAVIEKAVSGETTTVEDLKKSGKLKKGSDVKKEDLSGAIATTERELESMVDAVRTPLKPGSAENTVGAGRPEQEPGPLKSADIPWGGAKKATNPRDVSEYF
jgi:phage recombination protein Bet